MTFSLRFRFLVKAISKGHHKGMRQCMYSVMHKVRFPLGIKTKRAVSVSLVPPKCSLNNEISYVSLRSQW